MRRLVQFLQTKWEEILVTGVWVPLVLAAILTADALIIALSLGGGVASLYGLYFLVDKLGRRRWLPTFGGEASGIPRRAILFTVGLQTDTIDYAIRGQKPEYLAFLCTGETDPVALRYEAARSLVQSLLVREARPAYPHRINAYYLGHPELASVVDIDALCCNILISHF